MDYCLKASASPSLARTVQGAGRGTQDAGCEAWDTVGACFSCLSEAVAPMVVGVALIQRCASPLCVILDDLGAGRVESAEA